jgi:hypothetical protein
VDAQATWHVKPRTALPVYVRDLHSTLPGRASPKRISIDPSFCVPKIARIYDQRHHRQFCRHTHKIGSTFDRPKLASRQDSTSAKDSDGRRVHAQFYWPSVEGANRMRRHAAVQRKDDLCVGTRTPDLDRKIPVIVAPRPREHKIRRKRSFHVGGWREGEGIQAQQEGQGNRGKQRQPKPRPMSLGFGNSSHRRTENRQSCSTPPRARPLPHCDPSMNERSLYLVNDWEQCRSEWHSDLRSPPTC